jgi:hypothetical protein
MKPLSLASGGAFGSLKPLLLGITVFSRPKGQFSTPVGDLICSGQKFCNDATQETQWWWGGPNHTEPQPHPLANFPKLAIAWNNLTVGTEWQVPKGLYWICGNELYTILPTTALHPVCWPPSGLLSSCSPSNKAKNYESPYIRTG